MFISTGFSLDKGSSFIADITGGYLFGSTSGGFSLSTRSGSGTSTGLNFGTPRSTGFSLGEGSSFIADITGGYLFGSTSGGFSLSTPSGSGTSTGLNFGTPGSTGLPFPSSAQASSSATFFPFSEVAETKATSKTRVSSPTMASPDIVQKSVEATFKEMKQYSPKAYVKTEADPLFKEFITETATFAARKEVSLDRVFLQNPGIDVVSLLTDTLSKESIQLIQKAFTIPTFDMKLEKIMKGDKEVIFAEFKMEDKEFLPPLRIKTRDDIDVAKDRQYASILHDALAFCLDVCEVTNHISKAITKSVIEKAATWIKESLEIREAFKNFVESWRRAGSNNREKAKAVYVLLKDAVASDQLSMVLQICTPSDEMSWSDRAGAVANVIATIIAARGNGGRALTAKILLALTSGHNLQKRIRDVGKLEEVEKNLPESKKTDAVFITS